MQNPDQIYTLEDYWKMVEICPKYKYEYVDGYIRMMTGGSPAHAQLEFNLARVVGNALLNSKWTGYGSDAVIQLFDTRCYCPDLTVSCDPTDGTQSRTIESPTLVVEILSPSTEKIDKTEKLEVYKKYPTIQEILMIDSRKCWIEHHHRLNTFKWETALYTSNSDSIDLPGIGISVLIGDIYYKVYLELEQDGKGPMRQ